MSITIPEVELLSADDEVRLAKMIEVGVFAAEALARDCRPCGASADELAMLAEAGRAAHQEFFIANLRMAARLAHRWSKRSGLSADELFQEGCVGLGEAVLRWDHRRGYRFSTFAFSRVEWSILEAVLMRCGQVEISRSQARSVQEIQRSRMRLEAELGRFVSISDVAEDLGRNPAAVANALQPDRPDNLSDELIELIADETSTVEQGLPDCALDLIKKLPKQEKTVLSARFGLGEPAVTRAVLAERLRVSQSTVRRIEKRALCRARRMLEAA